MIRAGKNIEIIQDGEDTFINAPVINVTVLKSGVFKVSGDAVEVIAGDGIKITTTHPDKLIISANIDKEKLRIVELEKAVKALQIVIADLLKPEVRS
jgi:hypothetical protein